MRWGNIYFQEAYYSFYLITYRIPGRHENQTRILSKPLTTGIYATST